AALLLTVLLAPDGLTGLLGRAAGRLFGRLARALPEAREPPPSVSVDGLTVEELAKSFGGVRAVDGVSLELRPGGITGLI
ncbi:hypothetical protein ABTG71_20230, partial [Acinetobacter baumannii]